jgi:hypothetical protein
MTETREIVALATLQFSWGGLFDSRPADGYMVHLVRYAERPTGTPGPTLCGIDRFAKDAPGWSVGGGTSGPNIEHKPCPGCVQVARVELPDLPIVGLGHCEVSAQLDVPSFESWWDLPKPGVRRGH